MLITATERQDALWFLRLATTGYRADDRQRGVLPAVTRWPSASSRGSRGIGPLGAALLVSNARVPRRRCSCCTRSRGWSSAAASSRGAPCCSSRCSRPRSSSSRPTRESLFLLLSVSAFWFARRDRWAWAAVAGAARGRDAERRRLVDRSRSPSRRCTSGARGRRARCRGSRGRRDRGSDRSCTSAYWQVRFGGLLGAVATPSGAGGARRSCPLTTLGRRVLLARRYQTLLDGGPRRGRGRRSSRCWHRGASGCRCPTPCTPALSVLLPS